MKNIIATTAIIITASTANAATVRPEMPLPQSTFGAFAWPSPTTHRWMDQRPVIARPAETFAPFRAGPVNLPFDSPDGPGFPGYYTPDMIENVSPATVPLPGAMWLFIAAISGLAAWGRRQR